MSKTFYTYILASKPNGTLYVGCTSNIIQRVYQHKMQLIKGFSSKYNVDKLVYFEIHENIDEAARREKRFKNWCRQWKINLIEKNNPKWDDLYYQIIK